MIELSLGQALYLHLVDSPAHSPHVGARNSRAARLAGEQGEQEMAAEQEPRVAGNGGRDNMGQPHNGSTLKGRSRSHRWEAAHVVHVLDR